MIWQAGADTHHRHTDDQRRDPQHATEDGGGIDQTIGAVDNQQ
jgi:fatty-acid desaturase